jgi:membrane-associated protease RseP (regulator of RpoE activity)
MGYTPLGVPKNADKPDRLWLHALLFGLTIVSTMLAGAAWASRDPNELSNITHGVTYSVLLLTFLSAHEFGHYFAARVHGVRVTLPFYIPMPLLWLMPFGTMGALIRIKERITRRDVLFDVGVAGPLAGFVVCCGILGYGFANLPDFTYLTTIHPEYATPADIPSTGMTFGENLLFAWFRSTFAPQGVFVPPMNEIYHYPFLCVGWFGLFVTALNMLPFGQLDGGHVLTALIGRRQRNVATILWWVMFGAGVMAMMGSVRMALLEPSPEPWVIALQQWFLPVLERINTVAPWLFKAGDMWLFWALLIRLVIKIPHPSMDDPQPLSPTRRVVGWLAMAILLLSFTPRPIFMG